MFSKIYTKIGKAKIGKNTCWVWMLVYHPTKLERELGLNARIAKLFLQVLGTRETGYSPRFHASA